MLCEEPTAALAALEVARALDGRHTVEGSRVSP